MAQTRRAFLQQASAAVALGLLPQRPARELWAAPPEDLFPEPSEAFLTALALKAVDASRSAGATFADVRLTIGRQLQIICSASRGRPELNAPVIVAETGYGIRTIVDGAWGFASGFELTDDRVTAVAREAVAIARSNRPRKARTLALAPLSPVARGRWATPIEQDPFTVPAREQGELALAAAGAALRVDGVHAVHLQIVWDRLRHVFASTEDALIIQQLDEARPESRIVARAPHRVLGTATGAAAADTLRRGGYGYEAVSPVTLAADMRRAAERARARAEAATVPKAVEVGRYDLVFSPQAVATLLVETLARAVDLERALGYRANGEGTTFAAPPTDTIGRYRTASSLLTLHADRSQPHGLATVGWDDEGTPPEEYTFVNEGVITDYHTSRQTAPHLADWHRLHGRPLRSHGCTRGVGQGMPVTQVPNIIVHPAPGAVSLGDLIADTRRGLYVEHVEGASDHQLLSGQYRGFEVREIVQGRLGGSITNMALQFITQPFWKSLDAIGGPSSTTPVAADAGGGSTDILFSSLVRGASTVSAVPARVRQVNVLNTGRTG